jgi:transcriptional regulator with XRE-family HTH domain
MLRGMRTVERRSLAAEDLDLAQQIGTRLRAARQRAGLTQQQVAAGRYTKAYVSALENGLIKPSMAALRFLAVRLGTTPSDLLSEPTERWARIESEIRLASGDWQAAIDGLDALLERDPQGIERARTLLGLAEGHYRIGNTTEAIRAASEADERFAKAGHREESQRARYWLAAGHHQGDNPAEARLIFEQLLAEHSEAGPLLPDFRVRVLIALGTVLSNAGEPKQALLLLEEARGIGADLDDRRRATLYASLAEGYRATGDMEAAIRTGLQSLTLFRAAEADAEAAWTENELAMIYLALGNLRQATRHAGQARTAFENMKQDRFLAHVLETEAQIALAAGDSALATDRAAEAAELARKSGNGKAEVSALFTEARAARAAGDKARAAEVLAVVAGLAKDGPKSRLREILTEWSELCAESGDLPKAYELSRQALSLV